MCGGGGDGGTGGGGGGGGREERRRAAFISEDDCIPAFSQEPSRRKDRTDLRSQQKGELAFH